MKTDKNNGADIDTNNSIITSTKTEDRRPTNSILITILPILSMIAAILPGILNKTSGIEIAKVAILTMILTTVATFYIRLNLDTILENKLARTVITISYLASICLLLTIPKPYLYCFWMLGGLLVAMVIDNKLGLLFHFSLSFVMGISLSTQPEVIQPEIMIHIMIIGVVMNMLASALRSPSTTIYAMIIILSTNVTLSFVINNFIFNSELNYNYLYSLFSIFAVLITAFLLSLLYDRVTGASRYNSVESSASTIEDGSGVAIGSKEQPTLSNNNMVLDLSTQNHASGIEEVKSSIITSSLEEEKSSSISSVTEEVKSSGISSGTEEVKSSGISTGLEEVASSLDRIIGTSSSYDVLCSPDNELLMRLKAYSETLYDHALHIADLSARAAKLIGASQQLATAGGLYHEIGKLNGKNYIEEGLIIAEDYAFPGELKAILREHNIKYDKPSSVEAAIVMLSDSVVSTIDYIAKSEERKFTTNKIIDNIFQMRMDKGTFDGTNLSLKDFKLLKDFYQKEFNREET